MGLTSGPSLAQNAGPGPEGAAATAEAGGDESAAGRRVVVLPFELIDSSLEGDMLGENPDETRRLRALAPKLEEDFATVDGFEIVDTAPVASRVRDVYLQSCGDCGLSFAKELGADLVVIGTVQKVSNLILNINAYVYDVGTGTEIARGSADIRSNTDESWRRGLDYLFENVLKKQLEKRN